MKKEMNAFKCKMKQEGHNEEVIKNYLQKEYERYHNIYNKEEVQDYFNHVIAAIMLAQHKRYRNFTIEIPYRLKAPKSITNKLEDYVAEEPILYDINTREPKIHIKQILDIFAMKIVAGNRPPTFHTSNIEINELVAEKKENHKFLTKMQEFKSKIIEDEFENPITYNFNDCTKKEYFENCELLLKQIKTLVNPKATNLLKKYDKAIADTKNCLSFIKAANDQDELIDEMDFEAINFFTYLDDFTSRIHDKLDLAVLTKQFTSLFKNNEVFEQLGISLNNVSKEKRTSNGFVSNFVYINTLLGPVECQLQSQHEYEEGNCGYSAHGNLEGKAIEALKIPTNPEEQEKINQYIQNIKKIAPKSYLAKIDSTEKNRVMIQEFDDIQNYQKVTGQVTKGDPCERYILNYFNKLGVLQDEFKTFQFGEKTLGFVDYDIQRYLKSETLANLKKQTQPFHENETDYTIEQE